MILMVFLIKIEGKSPVTGKLAERINHFIKITNFEMDYKIHYKHILKLMQFSRIMKMKQCYFLLNSLHFNPSVHKLFNYIVIFIHYPI